MMVAVLVSLEFNLNRLDQNNIQNTNHTSEQGHPLPLYLVLTHQFGGC